MADILEEIVAHKLIEVERQKELIPPHTLYKEVESIMTDETYSTHSMKSALQHSATGIIAEFKRKSPSKGWIKEEGQASIIPATYCQNGAAAISILTDQKYFGGSLDHIRTARPKVTCPILRKDFIIDEYQIFQARQVDANAILLIAADLTREQCKQLAHTAHELKLETLLEIHTQHELDHICDDIDMIGVNNRNLGTFHTDVNNSFRLASQLPQDLTLVSESGISQADTVNALRTAGFRGFLIGETFMREDIPGHALAKFINAIK